VRVFISWSAERSRRVALLLRDWLPSVLQAVVPFMSDEDIPKGSQWLSTLNAELARAKFGIACVTAENQNSPWLNFEAGAIANAVGETRFCPLLLNLSGTDVRPPMSIFQMSYATDADLWKLVQSLNDQLEQKLREEQLRRTYQMWLPSLLKEIETALSSERLPIAPAHRETSELVQETLQEVREQSRVLKQILTRLPTASPTLSDELAVSLSRGDEAFNEGDIVRHHKWGEGTVLSKSGAGGDGLLTINFPNFGRKMVMLKYAPLTKVAGGTGAVNPGDEAKFEDEA
jgi:hypothetical protein